jgi:thiol-disulfide isomerase/thioredoxin
MKKVVYVVIVFVFSFMSNAQVKKYVTFQAEVANRTRDSIFIKSNRKLIKTIKVDKNGVFKDTLNIATGRYLLEIGNEFTIVYLKNGFDLKLKMDTKQFDESIVYSGKGALENNFLAKNSLFEEQTNMGALLESNEFDFKKGLDTKKVNDLKRLENKKLDPEFVALQKKSIDENYANVVAFYKQNLESNLVKSKLNNSPSPTFDYLNYAGGNTKLEDFKGKYVYIDVWATWCGPCRQEIPFLKKAEEKYHDKNIAFVSISIDNLKDQEKWKTMVKEKELSGVQLFADNDWNSKFVQDYKITGIPRFILIDPNGNVVKADAARPSSDELIKELDSLLKK